MKVTIERLRAANACSEHVKLFEAEYPDGVEPTVEALFEAASAGLDVAWTWHLLRADRMSRTDGGGVMGGSCDKCGGEGECYCDAPSVDVAQLVRERDEARAECASLQAKVERLRDFARSCRDNYDCDDDAHKHGTTCRCCEARDALIFAAMPK